MRIGDFLYFSPHFRGMPQPAVSAIRSVKSSRREKVLAPGDPIVWFLSPVRLPVPPLQRRAKNFLGIASRCGASATRPPVTIEMNVKAVHPVGLSAGQPAL
jgi:hypothetical protein